MEDKEEESWITLEDEKEEEEDFIFNPRFNERIEELHARYDLREYLYPISKNSDRPAIMGDVEAFRYGFKYPENAFHNLTKSTLTKILKDFIDYASLPDSLFVLGNVKFLTELFDLEEVREQVKALLTSPFIIKSESFVFALEYMLKYPRVTEAEKGVISELLSFVQFVKS